MPCAGGSYSTATNNAAASDCTSVDAGYFAPTGSTAQTPCAKGTYMDASITVKDSCTACTGGKYMDQEGTTACKACDAGYYCSPGSAAPLPCPGGRRMDTSLPFMTSEDDCITCDAGYSCSVGTANQSACLPGSYGPEPGRSTCLLCPAGKFTGNASNVWCQPCTRGYLCVEGSSAPQPWCVHGM